MTPGRTGRSEIGKFIWAKPEGNRERRHLLRRGDCGRSLRNAYDGLNRREKGSKMAQKVEVTLIDDLDGGKADETVTFSLDGAQYVIDLSGKNAKQLRESLARYIDAARKEKGIRLTGRGGRRASAAPSGPDTSEVRTWAKAQGYDVSERGRVSKDLIVKFQEAHG